MHEYLKKKWKTEECGAADCWCNIIVPVDPDDKNDCVIPSGSINKEIAEHIVKLHNNDLDKCKLWMPTQNSEYHLTIQKR